MRSRPSDAPDIGPLAVKREMPMTRMMHLVWDPETKRRSYAAECVIPDNQLAKDFARDYFRHLGEPLTRGSVFVFEGSIFCDLYPADGHLECEGATCSAGFDENPPPGMSYLEMHGVWTCNNNCTIVDSDWFCSTGGFGEASTPVGEGGTVATTSTPDQKHAEEQCPNCGERQPTQSEKFWLDSAYNRMTCAEGLSFYHALTTANPPKLLMADSLTGLYGGRDPATGIIYISRPKHFQNGNVNAEELFDTVVHEIVHAIEGTNHTLHTEWWYGKMAFCGFPQPRNW